MTITDQQARAVAYLLHELREDWGVTSLMSLIDKHRDIPDLGALIIAATRKALEPSCKTPGPIFAPGPHWPEKTNALMPKPPPCPDHIGKDAHNCASCWADVHCGQRPRDMIGKHWEPVEDEEA